MNNDQEWRSLILSELKDIKEDLKEVKKEMTTLKVKVVGVASFIGAIINALFGSFN